MISPQLRGAEQDLCRPVRPTFHSPKRQIRGATTRRWMSLGLAITFSLNFVLLYSFQRQHSMKDGAPLMSPDGATTKVDPCPRYGCPIYPPELTPYLNEMLQEVFVNQTKKLPDDFTFASSNFVMLTQRGKSHFVNQDRSVMISPYVTAATTSPTDFFLGVFDGHGQDRKSVV